MSFNLTLDASFFSLVPTFGSICASVLLYAAALCKCAQFPFSNWLANAMSGPTPASSLLHSSTIIVSGVVLLSKVI